MDIASWWSRVSADDRRHLFRHNGDSVPEGLRARLVLAGAAESSSDWWVADGEDPTQFTLADEVVDWIEAAANDESEDGMA